MPSFHTALPPDCLSLAHDLGRISFLDVPTEEGTERNGPLIGPIHEHPSLRNNNGEESEVPGLVGGPVGNLVPPKLCPAPPTTVYECCWCIAVLSHRTFCNGIIFLSCTSDVVMATGTTWRLSLWTMVSVPRVMNFFMCLCGIDAHECRYPWKPEEDIDPLELELSRLWRAWWGSSERAIWANSHWAISAALELNFGYFNTWGWTLGLRKGG